jgi:hypothetical protein
MRQGLSEVVAPPKQIKSEMKDRKGDETIAEKGPGMVPNPMPLSDQVTYG